MTAAEILVLGPMPDDVLKSLSAAGFTLREAADASALADVIAASAHSICAIADASYIRLTRELLAQLPRCRMIAHFGSGYDTIDATGAAALGIVVTNTPDVLSEEVADTAIGLLLMTVREFAAAERFVRAGCWVREGAFRLTPSLREREIGIVGLGRIGLAVARRLAAMGVEVSYHNRRPRPDVPYRYFANLVDFAHAMDTLVVTASAGTGSTKLIDAHVLEALGADGILINVGRGSLVDEAELLVALKTGRLRAVGLDVFAQEPDIDPAFASLDNVVLLPHVGSASFAARAAMGDLVVKNLVSWFSGDGPLTAVPETPWDRLAQHGR